jgi:hypothetical protein
MSDALYDLALPGCTPEPLMAYLKALGILRLVSEQKDKEARGWWKNDVFWLRSSLDHDRLVKFFLEEYRPTPVVVPWSGGDFFGVNWKAQPTKFKKTPTSSQDRSSSSGTPVTVFLFGMQNRTRAVFTSVRSHASCICFEQDDLARRARLPCAACAPPVSPRCHGHDLAARATTTGVSCTRWAARGLTRFD